MRPTPPARGCLRQSVPAFALVLSLVAGCNSAGGTLHKVSGKVTVDGSPLTTGNVRFVPDKARGNTATAEPVGQVGADGTYTLSTNGKAGAPAGWYKVTVDATEVPESSKPFSGKTLVARKYNAPESSGLSVEVVSSPKPGAYDLQVTSR
jgi:hypothetical protein